MFIRSHATTSQSRGQAAPPVLDRLEPRLLMAANLKGGNLTITGTREDDVITVSRSTTDPSTVTVNLSGVVTTHPLADITRGIRVKTLNGNDSVSIGATGPDIDLPARIDGGNGDDTLRGSDGDDRITGGKGDDSLFGNGGDDDLRGDAGDDDLHGGNGTDRVTGGKGEDVFQSSDLLTEISDLREDDGVRISLNEAPAPVQTSVLNLSGPSFDNLLRESDDGDTVFELEWRAGNTPNSAKIQPDGTVIERETEISPSNLPPAVQSAVAAKYPTGTITEAETLVVPEGSFFEVEVLVRNRSRELRVTPGGEIVDDELQPR